MRVTCRKGAEPASSTFRTGSVLGAAVPARLDWQRAVPAYAVFREDRRWMMLRFRDMFRQGRKNEKILSLVSLVCCGCRGSEVVPRASVCRIALPVFVGRDQAAARHGTCTTVVVIKPVGLLLDQGQIVKAQGGRADHAVDDMARVRGDGMPEAQIGVGGGWNRAVCG